MDIIRLGVVNPVAQGGASFTDEFNRSNADTPGGSYVRPPDDQLREFQSGVDFPLVSHGLIGVEADATESTNIAAARLLTPIPGDQRIEVVLTIPSDMTGYLHMRLIAHMNGVDASCRTAYWEIGRGVDPSWPDVHDQSEAGVETTISHHAFRTSETSTYTLRFDSKVNGDWTATINGVVNDLGSDFLPFEPGDFVGFSMWWNHDGYGDSDPPRIESFHAETLEAGTVLNYTGGAIINGLKSKTWIERYAEPGEFKLVGTLTGNEVDAFGGDAFDGLPLGALISHLNTYEVMIVENREIEINEKGDPQITVSGRSLETILDNRVIGSNKAFPYATTPLPDFQIPRGTLGAQILYLLNWHLGTGAYTLLDAKDKFPNVKPLNQSTARTNYTARTIKRGSLYERTKELLALGKLGIRIVRPNPTNTLGDVIAMSVHNGVDRRNRVEFTSAGGDLETVSYLFSTKSLKNTALISGRWLETMVKSPQSGYDRRVMYIDGSDIDRSYETAPTGTTRTTLLNRMAARARQALASQTGVSITNAELTPDPPFTYRVDYSTGDLVTIHGDFDVRAVKRVTEYTETEDETGASSYPTFGDV